MSTLGPAAPAAPISPSLSAIFWLFASVSLSGFGGVLAWARRALVERRKWMTAEEFNDLFALSQFLPGPNIVNFSVVYGARLHGPAGALVALAGLLGPPVVIVTVLGILYSYHSDIDALRRVLGGISAAAAGMLVATAAKMSAPVARDRAGLAVALVTFAAVGLFRLSLPVAIAALVPISIAIAWWVRR